MTAITGRSGAGKTTLLKLVAGLDRPSSGQVILDGHPLGDRDREQLASLRRERIGYLPQEPVPIGFLSAEENAVLVEPGNPQALVAAIDRIRQDPALGERLARQAAEDVGAYTWARRAERLEALFAAVTGAAA